MKRKGELTRERIIAASASLLNREGYLRTPVSDIMRATGMQKGGIYNHFASREELGLEAFNYAFRRIRERLLAAIAEKTTARQKLLALIEVFRGSPARPDLEGGCPVMNLAIESDDADAKLRQAARQAMGTLHGLFERLIKEGVARHEFAKRDARATAIHLVAALEGALMLTNLYKDPEYLDAVSKQLTAEVEGW
ncbi:MAG TPA: TetR/AcrR family transcriptional regulator [Burkholderiales bacterium]|jgi:AcrR family transcriptional regulator|nr:TetR/AcrR family transcriptional regulator [Burkholderiales bacterium]